MSEGRAPLQNGGARGGDRLGSGRWALPGAPRGHLLFLPHSWPARVRGFPGLRQHSQRDGGPTRLTRAVSRARMQSAPTQPLHPWQGPAVRPASQDRGHVAETQLVGREACATPAPAPAPTPGAHAAQLRPSRESREDACIPAKRNRARRRRSGSRGLWCSYRAPGELEWEAAFCCHSASGESIPIRRALGCGALSVTSVPGKSFHGCCQMNSLSKVTLLSPWDTRSPPPDVSKQRPRPRALASVTPFSTPSRRSNPARRTPEKEKSFHKGSHIVTGSQARRSFNLQLTNVIYPGSRRKLDREGVLRGNRERSCKAECSRLSS